MNKKSGPKPKLTADEATLKTVKGLGLIQATSKECAAVLGVSEPTWISFKANNPEVEEALRHGQGEGLTSLRRQQFQVAMKGNPTMLIWLGKQFLDQRDRQSHEHAGRGGGPIQTVDLSKLSGDDLARLETIFGPLAASGGDDAADQGGEG